MNHSQQKLWLIGMILLLGGISFQISAYSCPETDPNCIDVIGVPWQSWDTPNPINQVQDGGGLEGNQNMPTLGEDGEEEETEEECKAKADKLVEECQSLYTWNYATATVFCARASAINVFFGAGCQQYLNDTNNNAQSWCTLQGEKYKNEKCK